MRYDITSMLALLASVGETNALSLRNSNSIQDKTGDVVVAAETALISKDSGATARRLEELKSNIPRELDESEDKYHRRLVGCAWSETTPSVSWHPKYSQGWSEGYCQYTIDCDTPSYSSELECCKGAYAGQVSGKCLSQLPSPPTSSPTSAGGLDVYYPDYGTAWPDAYCINDGPLPSGRPTYATMLECCKGAYAGQMSGKCISMLPSPPTSSPTNSDFEADFWYPEYEKPWAESGCSNKLPLPFRNKNDRPTYATQLECCKAAYGGQMSGSCLAGLPNPPTASPIGTAGSGQWWPDYDTPWGSAKCVDRGWDKPYPLEGSRPLYDSNLACCLGSYGGQSSLACYCSVVPTPDGCIGVAFAATTSVGVTITTTITLGDLTVPPAGPERDALITSLQSSIKATVEGTLEPGDSVTSVSILSIGGETLRRSLRSAFDRRDLQDTTTTTDLDIEIDLETAEVCQDENCTDINVDDVGDDVGNEIVISFKNGGLANAFAKSGNVILIMIANKGGIKGVKNPVAVANMCKNKGKGKGKDKKGCDSFDDSGSGSGSSGGSSSGSSDSSGSSGDTGSGTQDPLSTAPTASPTDDSLP